MLDLDDFYKSSKSSDGFKSRCKQCQKSAEKRRLIALECFACGIIFSYNRKRKFCLECSSKPKPPKISFEECMEKVASCKSRLDFQNKYLNYRRLAVREGWTEVLEYHDHLRKEISYLDCFEAAKKCISLSEFRNLYFSQYRKSLKKGWLKDFCLVDNPLPNQEECFEAQSKCDTKTKFREKFPRHYRRSLKQGWFAKYIFDVATKGHSKSDFIDACYRRNDKLGCFYVIKCEMGSEWFYKFGITSKGIFVRYANDSSMPYDFEVVIDAWGDPEQIWELERQYYKSISNFKYLPEVYFGGCSNECFKCNKNNKLLQGFL